MFKPQISTTTPLQIAITVVAMQLMQCKIQLKLVVLIIQAVRTVEVEKFFDSNLNAKPAPYLN